MSNWITKDRLRRAVRRRLLRLGFHKNRKGYSLPQRLTKDEIRDLHGPSRRVLHSADHAFLMDRGFALLPHFADGREIAPATIDPELVEVSAGSQEAELFRIATLLWSVPVSGGFGRRLRFLVRDRQNGKLIGVFALGDPVFNLNVRDEWIGWSTTERSERLVHVMDAYVVGAVPPYAQLIGGKLVAALMTSQEVLRAYDRKYLGTTSVINRVQHQARLVLVTTTSALGRSSLYNRLAIPDGPQFIRLGVTSGFGHFHLSGHLFELMRKYLEQIGHPYASGNRFGMGPNWKLRVARAALDAVGLESRGILRHGIAREVYAVPLAYNWKEILVGSEQEVRYRSRSVKSLAESCKDRWVVPRSLRDPTYLAVTRASIRALLISGRSVASSQPRPARPQLLLTAAAGC